MFPKCSLLSIGVLSCALVFGSAGTAGAQHRHGGHGGHALGGHGGHGHGGHGGFGHLNLGFGYGGYGGYGGYYGGYYSDPYYYSYYPSSYRSYPYSSYGSYDYGSSSYYAPASSYLVRSPTPAQPAARTARIEIRVPDGAAQVWFDGAATTSRGTGRTFETPDLQTGRTFTYTIRASWEQGGQPVTDERVVEVAAGRASVVDFTRPATERIPLPKK